MCGQPEIKGPGRSAMPVLQHLSRQTPTDKIWQIFEEDGGLIIDNFLDASTLQRLRDDFMPLISEHPAGASSGHDFWKAFQGESTKRITGLANVSMAWGDVLCDPLYKGMADRYLGTAILPQYGTIDLYRTQ